VPDYSLSYSFDDEPTWDDDEMWGHSWDDDGESFLLCKIGDVVLRCCCAADIRMRMHRRLICLPTVVPPT